MDGNKKATFTSSKYFFLLSSNRSKFQQRIVNIWLDLILEYSLSLQRN
jgi:hypothetical protein